MSKRDIVEGFKRDAAVLEEKGETLQDFSLTRDLLRQEQERQRAGFAIDCFGVIVAPGKQYTASELDDLSVYRPTDDEEARLWKEFFENPSKEGYAAWQARMIEILQGNIAAPILDSSGNEVSSRAARRPATQEEDFEARYNRLFGGGI